MAFALTTVVALKMFRALITHKGKHNKLIISQFTSEDIEPNFGLCSLNDQLHNRNCS